MFINGQRVACCDDTGLKSLVDAGLYTAIPQKDKVYVVRGMTIGIDLARREELAVYLVGIHNPCSNTPPYPERGFNANRFRPLDELTEEQILALSKPEELVEK